jgi:hypothetical protein
MLILCVQTVDRKEPYPSKNKQLCHEPTNQKSENEQKHMVSWCEVKPPVESGLLLTVARRDELSSLSNLNAPEKAPNY